MKIIGVFSIVLAGLGLSYNATTLFGDFSEVVEEREIPHFYPAFYAMSAICIICYALLVLCGIQFLRLRTGLLALFIALLVFEVVYFFSIVMLWGIPKLGMSVAAATGVANGGLVFQGLILFPLWAPFVARWAAKRTSDSGRALNQGIQPTS